MKKHKPFEPSKRGNLMLSVTTYLFAAGAAGMWILKREIDLDTPTVFMVSGIALFMIIMNISGKVNAKMNYQYAKELKEKHEAISIEAYKKNDIFFRDEDKNNTDK
ncbi:MAG: hypothetical protein ACI4KF_02145 [Huintestinicola sp.]